MIHHPIRLDQEGSPIRVMSTKKGFSIANESYYVDWAEYASSLQVLIDDGYHPSVSYYVDTGEIQYYVSVNGQKSGMWENQERIFRGELGRIVTDSSSGWSIQFKNSVDFSTWYSGLIL